MLAFVLNQIFANKSDAAKFVKFSKYEAVGQEAVWKQGYCYFSGHWCTVMLLLATIATGALCYMVPYPGAEPAAHCTEEHSSAFKIAKESQSCLSHHIPPKWNW